MGSDATGTYLRALGVPFTLKNALTMSTGSQDGPQPGTPEASADDVEMRLVSSGTMRSDASYTVKTINSGNPGPGGGAQFLWKNTSDADKMYRGRDVQTISAFTSIFNSAGTTETREIDCCRSDDDGLVITTHVTLPSGSSPDRIYVWTWKDGVVSSPVSLYQTGQTLGTFDMSPTVCKAENGYLYLCHWNFDIANDLANVSSYVSKDNGVTWEDLSERALRESIDVNTTTGSQAVGWYPRRLRLAVANGQALLMGHLRSNDTVFAATRGLRDQFGQWASNSLNGYFNLVQIASLAPDYNPSGITVAEWATFSHHSIFVYQNKFHVIFPSKAATVSNTTVTWQKDWLAMGVLGNAYEPMQAQIPGVDTNNRIAETPGTDPYFYVWDGSATQIASVLSVNLTLNYVAYGDGAGWCDDDGAFFWASNVIQHEGGGRDTKTKNTTFLMRSDSSFGTENAAGESVGRVFRYCGAGGVTGRYATDAIVADFKYDAQPTGNLISYSGCSIQGRQVLLSKSDAPNITFDNNVFALWLGGYTTINTPQRIQSSNENQRAKWTSSWIPVIDPNEAGLQPQTAGSGSITATDGAYSYLNSPSGSGNRAYFEVTTSAAADVEHFIVRCQLFAESGGTTADSHRVIGIELANAAGEKYDARLRITDTEVELWDYHDGGTTTPAQVGSTFTYTRGHKLDILFALGGTTMTATAWVRTAATYLDLSDRNFDVAGVITGPIDNRAAASADNQVYIGQMVGVTGSAMTTQVYLACFSKEPLSVPYIWDTSETKIDPGAPSYYSKFGRPYAGRGAKTYVDSGFSITATDGNARREDTYTIATRYEFPISATQWSNSKTPRVFWRSAAPASGISVSAQTFEQTFTQTTEDTAIGNGLFFLHLNEFHGGRIRFSLRRGGSYDLISLPDPQISFDGKRQGSSIVVTGGTNTKDMVLAENECVGWTVEADDTSNQAVYRIIGNTSGSIAGNTNTTKKATFFIEGVLGTDPLNNRQATFKLRPNKVTWVFCNPTGRYYDGLKLEISSHNGYEGRAKLGTMIFGRLFIPGRQYSRGRVIAYDPQTNSEINETGVMRSFSQGPGGRDLTIAWSDGIDTSNLQSNQADPDYLAVAGGTLVDKVGILNDVPKSMQGISSEIGLGDQPIVYLPSLAVADFPASGSSQVYVRNKDHILLQALSGVTIESVLGNESIDEVFRVASFNAREVR